jgi:hypothetical protein
MGELEDFWIASDGVKTEYRGWGFFRGLPGGEVVRDSMRKIDVIGSGDALVSVLVVRIRSGHVGGSRNKLPMSMGRGMR